MASRPVWCHDPGGSGADRRAASGVRPDDFECLPAVLEELCPEAGDGAIACWCRQLAEFTGHLYRWSGRMNLVAAGDRPALVRKHLIPSLLMRSVVVEGAHRRILDLGSGAGLPGIPLKIVLPDADFVLVESRRRRAGFLREVVRRLGLKRIRVENLRLEQWMDRPTDGVDIVTARAVADAAELFALVRPILAKNGRLLASLPTAKGPQDMEPPPAEVRSLGWRDVKVRIGVWEQDSGLTAK